MRCEAELTTFVGMNVCIVKEMHCKNIVQKNCTKKPQSQWKSSLHDHEPSSRIHTYFKI